VQPTLSNPVLGYGMSAKTQKAIEISNILQKRQGENSGAGWNWWFRALNASR